MDDPGLSGLPDPGAILPAAPALEPPTPEVNLGGYRALQVISILLMGLGIPPITLLVVIGALNAAAGGGTENVSAPPALVVLAAIGTLALIVGLVLNVTRSLIVRGPLPMSRYRGPAITVLLLLAVVIASVVAVPAALISEGNVATSLVLLTSTQVGLLAVIGGLVVVPKALAGLRILPTAHLGRSILLGFGLAIPAWIGATLIAAIVAVVLSAFGLKETPGAAELAVEQADPTVILVAFLVVAPIAEELFFRGVVFNAWEREWGPRVALFGSAALFALIHTDLFALAPIFALGIALALVYRTTRSLPASMAMHAGFNAISVFIAFLVRLHVLHLPG